MLRLWITRSLVWFLYWQDTDPPQHRKFFFYVWSWNKPQKDKQTVTVKWRGGSLAPLMLFPRLLGCNEGPLVVAQADVEVVFSSHVSALLCIFRTVTTDCPFNCMTVSSCTALYTCSFESALRFIKCWASWVISRALHEIIALSEFSVPTQLEFSPGWFTLTSHLPTSILPPTSSPKLGFVTFSTKVSASVWKAWLSLMQEMIKNLFFCSIGAPMCESSACMWVWEGDTRSVRGGERDSAL